jgi:DNA-binding NarL/FixJ family response regulator
LLSAIDDAFNDIEVVEVASVTDAQNVLERSRFDACLVCLDLPPAPLAGVKLAQAALRDDGRQRRPSVVLVTRSLRWLPASAANLRSLPWVAPDAGADEIARAVDLATGGMPRPPTSDVMLTDAAADEPPRREARRRRGR